MKPPARSAPYLFLVALLCTGAAPGEAAQDPQPIPRRIDPGALASGVDAVLPLYASHVRTVDRREVIRMASAPDLRRWQARMLVLSAWLDLRIHPGHEAGIRSVLAAMLWETTAMKAPRGLADSSLVLEGFDPTISANARGELIRLQARMEGIEEGAR